jgi:hypothetical protein
MAPHDRFSPSQHDQILLPPSQQHNRGRTFARRCDDIRLCRRKKHILETTTKEQAPNAKVLVTQQQQENVLLRASRRVLSGARRRHTVASIKAQVCPPHQQEEIEIPPQPHREYTLQLSRKHSSLQHSPQDRELVIALHDTWYYSSNHVLVNRERMMRGIQPLMRSIALDEMARTIATMSAENCPPQTQEPDTIIPKCYHGHVLVGESIRSMHERTLLHDPQARDKLLDVDYREFGMATCKGRDGRLHLCQLFDRTRVEI